MRVSNNAVLRLYKLVPPLYKKKLIKVILNSFIIVITDLIGVGILLPILLLVIDEQNVANNTYFQFIYTHGGFETEQSFTIAVCMIVLIMSLLRLFINTYLQYIQNRLLFQISSYLSLNLYRLYYNRGFVFVKRNNSHKLVNNLNGVANYLIQGYFIPYISLINEITVVCLILIGLMIFNIQVFILILLTFAPISLIYYRFAHNRIKRYGKQLFDIYPLKTKVLQQTFVGYSDMALSNSFGECEKQYKKLLEEQNQLSVKKNILTFSLQRVLELAVVFSIIVLIIGSKVLVLPSLSVIIGIFAIAVYRVLPGIVKSTGYIFTMRSNSFALKTIDDLEDTDKQSYETENKRAITFTNTIRFENVSFAYEPSAPSVLHNLSIKIEKGDFIGIRGESGSGKSTFFHLLLGFLQPDSGTIYIDDIPLTAQVVESWRQKIGYVSQQLFMVEGTLLDNIVMGIGSYKPDMQRVNDVLRCASLDKFVSSLADGVMTKVGEGGCTLSGGQRQRLGIARALYKNAEIMLFDEATSSLDEQTEANVNEAISGLAHERRDLTILVISHHRDSLSICSQILDIASLQS